MRYGKLSEEELKEMLSAFAFSRGEIIKGACIGCDTAIIRCGDYISVTSDPITAYVDNAGELAIDINANDIYASGAEPFAAMVTVLAPPETTAEEVLNQMRELHRRAAEKGIAVIGGHTEFTDAVTRTVISVTMLGRTLKLLNNSSIKPGDAVIVTKSLGLEGAKIILDNDPKRAMSILSIEEAMAIREVDLSVERESAALRHITLSAMHDITEGGVAGAAKEIAASTRYGIRLYEKKLPVSSGVKALADEYGLDVRYLISSGSMMIIAEDARGVLRELEYARIPAAIIGEVTAGRSEIVLKSGLTEPIEVKTDEIYRFMNSLETHKNRM